MSEPTLYEDQEAVIISQHQELHAARRLLDQLTQTNRELCERAEKAEAENEKLRAKLRLPKGET